MTKQKIHSPKELHKFLTYDEESGKLYWNYRDLSLFSGWNPQATHKTWNTRFTYKEAMIGRVQGGYLVGVLLGRRYLAHRVIWAMCTGAWPVDQIDHIDGNPANNRLSNLREVTTSQNHKNTSLMSSNTSGKMGVNLHKPSNKWRARIKHEGKEISLGYYESKDEAIKARCAAEIKYGFHPNHGRSK